MTSPPHPARSKSHVLALLLACATFPLIWVGGLVTTADAGMAVPDWPTTYGYNLFLYPWQTWLAGPYDLFIEHGHRLLGAAVGMLTIAVAAVVWWTERREWVRWLGVAALAAVIVQGVIGGLRVELGERLLAQVHGTFGPAFFALTLALAVVTSPRWLTIEAAQRAERVSRLARLATVTTLVAYLQLAVGARVRHMPDGASPAEFQVAVLIHLFLAAVLAGHVALLAWRTSSKRSGVLFESANQDSEYGQGRPADSKKTPDPFAASWLARPAWALAALVALQVCLGLGTWVVNYGFPAWLGGFAWAGGHVVQGEGFARAVVTTAHQATGSLIVATSLVAALRSWCVAGRAWQWLHVQHRAAEAVL